MEPKVYHGEMERAFGLGSVSLAEDPLPRKTQETPGGPWAVYELFNDAGDLLYVGMSGNVARRLAQHESGKEWWIDVATVRIRRYVSKKDAAAKEKIRVLCGEPRHNKTFNVFGGVA